MSKMSDLDIEKTEMADLKSTVKVMLHVGLVDLEFEKADGSIRLMTATLNQKYLPPLDELKLNVANDSEEKRMVNENIVTCFDVEKQAWRSFRVDRLHQFTAINEGM